MWSHVSKQSHHSAVNFTTAPSSLSTAQFFSTIFIPKHSPNIHTHTQLNMHTSSSSASPGPAVSVPDRLTPALPGHRAGQRPGQQHLPEKSGPEREQHGRHRSQDAEQSPADQHHAKVNEKTCRERILLCFCSIASALYGGLYSVQLSTLPCRSVTWDRNNTSAAGFLDVARALEQ